MYLFRRHREAPVTTPFAVRSVFQEQLPENYNERKRGRHNFSGLFHCKSGEITYDTTKGMITLKRGRFLILLEGFVSRICSKPGYACSGITVIGPVAKSILENFGLPISTPFNFRLSTENHVRSILEAVKRPGLEGERFGAARFFDLLTFMANHLNVGDPTTANRHRKLMEKAETMIYRELANPNFGVNQLANALGVSGPTLGKAFRQVSGISPKRYIDTLRLQEVSRMLNEEYTIREIAKISGFSSPEYLSRFFQRNLKMSPSDFRNSQRPRSH